MHITTAESWYETRTLADGVTWIYEPHIKPFYRCNIWHLRGRNRDLLIDSGSGLVPLRRQVSLLSGRPILAVAGVPDARIVLRDLLDAGLLRPVSSQA